MELKSKKEFCAFVDQSLGLKSNFQLAPVLRLCDILFILFSMDTADLAFEKLRQGTTLGKNVIRVLDSEVDYLADTSGVSGSGRSSSN